MASADPAAAVTAELLDFSYDRLTPSEVRAAGRVGVIRYVASGRPGVSADRAEVDSCRAAGLSFAAVWERGPARALGGWDAGLVDAADAAAYTAALGASDADPIYMAVDVNVAADQMPAVADYISGCAAVLGWARVGAYGQYAVMVWLRAHTACRWYWQTAAWSAGQLAPFAHLYQYATDQTVAGKAVDFDRALTGRYGQWGELMPTPADLGWGDPRNLTSADMTVCDIGEGVRLAVRNADVGTVFAALVRDLMAAGWDGPADPVVDDWGYARRLKRWAQAAGQVEATAPLTSWSEHAWGTAIDLDTVANPMLDARPADMWAHTNMPRATQAIAARLGLDWGGNWTSPWDPQHFQVAMTPAQTRDLAQQIRDQEDQMSAADVAAIVKAVDAAQVRLVYALGAARQADGSPWPAADTAHPDWGHAPTAARVRSLTTAMSALTAAVSQIGVKVGALGDDEANVLAAVAETEARLTAAFADGRAEVIAEIRQIVVGSGGGPDAVAAALRDYLDRELPVSEPPA